MVVMVGNDKNIENTIIANVTAEIASQKNAVIPESEPVSLSLAIQPSQPLPLASQKLFRDALKEKFSDAIYKIDDKDGDGFGCVILKNGKPFITTDGSKMMLHGERTAEENQKIFQALKDSRAPGEEGKPIFLYSKDPKRLEAMVKAAEKEGIPCCATMDKKQFDNPKWRKESVAELNNKQGVIMGAQQEQNNTSKLER